MARGGAGRAGRAATLRLATWRSKFLAIYSQTGNIQQSCRVVGISRQHFYLTVKRSAKFAAEVDEASKEAVDLLEQHAISMAFGGLHHYKDEKGEDKTKYLPPSERVLIFLLKARKPEVYGDIQKVELTGVGGGAVVIDTESAKKRLQMLSADPEAMGALRVLAERESALTDAEAGVVALPAGPNGKGNGKA
jgi:hypothetical protein